jgi:hypothetical protein
MTLLDRQRAYAAHPDPATAAANLVALVVAWNGPLYPLYGIALIGAAALPSTLTMLASPFFFAIPRIARWNPVAGRAALPLIGTLDTLGSMKLFGPEAGIDLFLLPCITLAGLLFRPRERWLGMLLIGLTIAPILVPAAVYGAPLFPLTSDQLSRLAALNLVSVAMLLGLVALQIGTVLARTERPQAISPDRSRPSDA